MVETLTIGIVPGVTPDKWVRVWRERMPAVTLRVVAIADGEARRALLDGVDMVFARIPLPDANERDPRPLQTIPLWDETPVVVVAKDHPVKLFESVTLAELADEELLPGADESTLDLVAAGHGVARMPRALFRATGRRDVLAREISDAEPTRIGLVWPASTSGPLIDEFIGVVRGRTANSSRGAAAPAAPEPPKTRAAAAPTKATKRIRGPRPGGKYRKR